MEYLKLVREYSKKKLLRLDQMTNPGFILYSENLSEFKTDYTTKRWGPNFWKSLMSYYCLRRVIPLLNLITNQYRYQVVSAK